MNLATATEAGLREYEVKTPHSQEELIDLIEQLSRREHDYGTCVYAMSICATATFNYIANILGVTGFQASCADLDIIKRTRGMNCPFIILKAEDMLYPQYDLKEKLSEAMSEWGGWAKEQASKKLAVTSKDNCHQDVWAHWESLAKM